MCLWYGKRDSVCGGGSSSSYCSSPCCKKADAQNESNDFDDGDDGVTSSRKVPDNVVDYDCLDPYNS
jgi:hypothetical protein